MSIFVNLEYVNKEIKLNIIKELETEFFPNDNNKTNYYKLVYKNKPSEEQTHSTSDLESDIIMGIQLDEDVSHLDRLRLKLKEILTRTAVTEYVVTKDPNNSESLIFIERSKLESVGILHCRHCGMEFEDEIQLGNHLRVHFII